MMSKNKRARTVFVKKSSVVATEIALAMMAAQIAYAQQPPEQAAPGAQPARTAAAEQVERIEITGTRLPALNVEGPSPVTVMNAQEMRMDGLSKTEDILLALPQANATQTSVQSNGATGTANVNLRNLGPTRHLVLVNGRRLPAGTPQAGAFSGAADLNQIPATVGGVPQADAGQLTPAAAFFTVPGDVGSDGAVNGVSFTMGRNFADNKGNATMFFGYKKEAAVSQSKRDFSACSLDDGDSL